MKKIYLIDDDVDFLQLMIELLGEKYNILPSTSLNLDEINRFKPDLIILDNFLGNTNGDRILRALFIKAPDFSIPIILMSGHEVNPTKFSTLIKGFIPKPCSIKVINQTIADFFEGKLELPSIISA